MNEVKSLLRQAAISAADPVRTEARGRLLSILLEEKDYNSLTVLGRTFLDSGSSPEIIIPILAEALYREKAYNRLLDLLNEKVIQLNDNLSTLNVIVHGLLGKKDWHTVFVSYVLNIPADPKKQDHYTRIAQEWGKNKLLKELSGQETDLFLFKLFKEKKKYRQSIESALGFLQVEIHSPSALLSPPIVDEITKTAVSSGRTKSLLELFTAIQSSSRWKKYSRGVKSHILWALGYLNNREGRPGLASAYYTEGLLYSGEEFHDKLLWYWYSSEFKISLTKALGELDTLTRKWNNPDYFSDILSDLTTDIIRKGRWKDIESLLESLHGKAGNDIISRLAYITARGADEGYFQAENKQIVTWYRWAIESGRGVASGLYYKIMAQAALQERKTGVNSPKPFRIFVSDDKKEALTSGVLDELLVGAVLYNLPEYGREILSRHPYSFSPGAIRFFAEFLKTTGDYLHSIRIISYYAALNGYRVSQEDIKILYPEGYSHIISVVRKKENLPLPVFTALIREESHFSPGIVSAAGAVGLSQLMPSTARDVARRIDLQGTNIKKPEVNLSLGGWYLGNLIKRTETVIDALFAYNGGLTRVRRWKKNYNLLPEDLFLEVIPYNETSLYGRKVLVSAVVYGYLYYDLSPVEVIKLFMNKR